MKKSKRSDVVLRSFWQVALDGMFEVDGVEYKRLRGRNGMDEQGHIREFADSDLVRIKRSQN